MKAGNVLFTYVFFSTIFFSRNDVSGQRFREAEGEASPQSPPAGALLLKKKKEKKEKKGKKKEKVAPSGKKAGERTAFISE